MYAQAQCTIALCELYGMTKDESLHIPCRKAIEFAEYAQSDLGGWRYHPKEDSDTSVTGWYVMALMSGKMAGLPVKDNILANVTKFLDSVQHEGGALYSYLDRDRPSLTMTAEGLLCRQYLGWKNYDPRLKAGADVLLDNLVSTERDERAYYYWYYATQMLHHLGGPAWKNGMEPCVFSYPLRKKRVDARPVAGHPLGNSGAYRAVASTAPVWLSIVWKSTTDTCLCMVRLKTQPILTRVDKQ